MEPDYTRSLKAGKGVLGHLGDVQVEFTPRVVHYKDTHTAGREQIHLSVCLQTPGSFPSGWSVLKAQAAFRAFRKFFFFLRGGTCSEISGSLGFLNMKSFSPVFNKSTVSAPTMGTGASSPRGSRDRCGQCPSPENATLSRRGGQVFFNMLKKEQKITLDIFDS